MFASCTVRPKNTIEMGDNFFSPESLAVEKGATATWLNKGKKNHTVTGYGFDSGNIAPGGTFTRAFGEDGRYEVICTLHKFMIGEVIVGTGSPRIQSPVEAGSRAE